MPRTLKPRSRGSLHSTSRRKNGAGIAVVEAEGSASGCETPPEIDSNRTRPELVIEIDPTAPSHVFNGRHDLWVQGRVSSDVRVDELSLTIDDKLSSRIVYGQAGASINSLHGSAAKDHVFAFNIARGASEAAIPCNFVIAAQTSSGAVEQESFTLAGSVNSPLATVISGPARLSAPPARAHPPITLYIERAVADQNGRISVSGWVLSVTPVVTVQLFLDQERIGIGQFNRPRQDVAKIYPSYPNAAISGFSYTSDTGVVGQICSDIRVQVLSLQGFSHEAVLPLERLDSEFPSAAGPSSTPVGTQDVAEQGQRRAIHLHCDEVRLSQDGQLLVEGWAVSPVGISRMEIRVDGEMAGQPDLGFSRLDVAEQFDFIPLARFSGFRFAQRINMAPLGEHQIEVLVANGLNDVKSEVRVVRTTISSGAQVQEAAVQGGQQQWQEFRLEVDMPTIVDGAVKHPVSGMLTIQGWSLAQTDIAEIEVFVDEVPMGEAHYGLSRQDVAAAFPDIERALRSGYVSLCALRGLERGEHLVKLRARTGDGKTAVREFRIDVQEDESARSYAQINRSIHPSQLKLYADLLGKLVQSPCFRLILRVSELGEEGRIEETLDSIGRQIYQDWRLSVITDGSKSKKMIGALAREKGEAFTGKLDFIDARRARHFKPAGEASIGDLEGDGATFYAFLSPGDQLGCDALADIALFSGRHPGADIIYADECRISPVDEEREAFFKPDWSPDLLLSTNYVGRPWFVTESVLRKSGATPRTLAQNGEYDLVLNCFEHASQINRFAKLLCYRGPAFLDEPAVEQRALVSAAGRRGIHAEVTPGCVPGTWRMRRLVESEAMVSIIVPTCAARGLIKTCIESLRSKTSYRNFEIICVDNIPPSKSDWKAWLKENADKVVDIPEAFNWSRFNNIAASDAKGEYLLFLNDDIEIIQSNWLEAMLEHAQRSEVGIVGPQLVYPDRKVQHAGMFLSTPGTARHSFRMLGENDPGYFGLGLTQRNVIAVTGACMLVRRDTFAQLGGFDEAHQVINNDLDFCLRAHLMGLQTIFTPYARLIHHELASRDRIEDIYDTAQFMTKWKTVFAQGDPYFSPRLSIHADDYRPDDEPAQQFFAGPSIGRVDEVRRILVVKLDHIGDFITSIPAIRRLKTLFPGATLHVLASKAAKSFIEFETSIDGFVEFEFFHSRSELGHKELSDADFQELRQQLLAYDFDLTVDLRMHPDTRMVLQHIPTRIRAGYDLGGQFPFLDIVLEWEKDSPLQRKRTHVSDALLNLVEAIGTALNPDHGQETLLLDSRDDILSRIPSNARMLFNKPVAAVHPGVGNPARQWPVGHFAALVDLLVEKSDLNVILIGGPDERALADAVLKLVANPHAVVSLAGETSLRDLPLLLKACVLYVGNNSGPKHIAAALGVPTIGIHSGVVDAAEWGPLGPRAFALQRNMLCKPCYLLKAEDCPRDMACLKQLEPTIVHQYADALLAPVK